MAEETTPLLATAAPHGGDAQEPKKTNSAKNCILLCSFLISLSFCFTQSSILYAFRLMTCDEYYQIHPPFEGKGDRCAVGSIEAGTAKAVALLGTSTTVFGVINLLITGGNIKRFGLHLTLMLQTFFPAIRAGCQLLGLYIGGNAGIWVFLITQVVTVFGGPAGYLLILNSYITEVVEPAERTGAFGQLGGCAMFGGAFGFFLGGISGEKFGIKSPFKAALVLMLISTAYSTFFLPYVPPQKTEAEAVREPSKGLAGMIGPLRMLLPQQWRMSDGRVRRQWGAPLLALGIFLGVLATGYIPTLVQMYATSAFAFGPMENGYLIGFNALIRGFFLSLAFPKIISFGRKWYAKSWKKQNKATNVMDASPTAEAAQPLLLEEDMEITVAPEFGEEPSGIQGPVKDEDGSHFDLFFLRWSLVVDGIITGLATFTKHGWQVYLVAFVLPLASGSAAAAKSVMIEMCPASEKADALSAIALVEMIAMVTTISIFGNVYAGLADIGKPNLTFACNAAFALVAVFFLAFSQFPPAGSKRVSEETRDEDAAEEQHETVPADGK